MSNEPVKQITAKELYEDWAIGNPHYEFELDFLSILSKPIKEITLNVVNRGVYCVDLGDFYVDVFADSVVNLYSKPRLFTELQDPSDLDATLPIDPRETAQRDHDEIQRLLAENAKMRGLLEGLAKFKDSGNGNLRHFATRAWNLLNRS